MHLVPYLGFLHQSQRQLAEAFRQVAAAHRDEVDPSNVAPWAGVTDALPDTEAAYVTDRRDDEAVRRLAELLYFNEAGIRVRTLLGPDGSRDLTRVVMKRAVRLAQSRVKGSN